MTAKEVGREVETVFWRRIPQVVVKNGKRVSQQPPSNLAAFFSNFPNLSLFGKSPFGKADDEQ